MQVFFHFIAKKIKKPRRSTRPLSSSHRRSPVRCHRLIGGAPIRCRVLPRVRPPPQITCQLNTLFSCHLIALFSCHLIALFRCHLIALFR